MRRILLVGAFAIFALSPAAFAKEDHLLRSEEVFVARMGAKARPVAEGVYEVSLANGEIARVAFGEKGREYDRARLSASLDDAMASLSVAPNPELERRIAKLETALKALAPHPHLAGKTAVTGTTCHDDQVQFPFSLDGGYRVSWNGPEVWGEASVGADVDFGPPPPRYRDRYAYSDVIAQISSTLCQEADDQGSITNGSLGVASSSAVLSCSNCRAWESFNAIYDIGCQDSYHSIDRRSGAFTCVW